ncbi:MAG: hypothetical protein WCT16_02665 [Candidatus Buchananbacteria bacterium]
MDEKSPSKEQPEVKLLLKYWGRITEVVAALIGVISELGGDFDECLRHLASAKGEGTIRKISELIIAEMLAAKNAVKEIVSPYLAGSYDVIVDLSQDLEQMIAAGRYNGVNSDINIKNFPLNKSGKRRVRKHKVRVELLHFNQSFKNGDQIIAKLKRVNSWLARQGVKYRYRFVRIEELLALGAAQSELQRQLMIAALGSIWHQDGYRNFVCLSGNTVERYLHLGSLVGTFGDYWRFAVVREYVCR